MIEYRRGVPSKRKSNHWHWRPECEFYPQDAFAIRRDKPFDDEICSQCKAASAA